MNNSIATLASNLQSAVNDVQARLVTTHTQIADGKRPLSTQESSVVARLSAQAAGQSGVKSSITNAQNIIDVAQTGLSTIASVLTKMQDLANQVTNGLFNQDDQTNLFASFTSLNDKVDKIAASTGINGNNLLSGNQTISIVVGTDGANNETALLQGIDITTLKSSLNNLSFPGGAATAVAQITQLVAHISSTQAALTAASTNLNTALDNSAALAANSQQAVDGIQNIDLTALQANLQALSVQQSLDFQVISQMNNAASSLLAIFR